MAHGNDDACLAIMRSMIADASQDVTHAIANAKANPFKADQRRSYRRDTLRRCDLGEVAYMEWPAGAGVDFHGHSEAAVLLQVIDGEFVEERYVFDGLEYHYERATLTAGDESYLPVGSIHRIRCSKGARSVHVFNPMPNDPTSVVPEEVWPLLHEARERAMDVSLDYAI